MKITRPIFSALFYSLSILSSLTLTLPSLAFQLVPMSQEFSPSGSQSTRSYQIKNTKKKSIAVEISIAQRFVDSDGNETRKPELEDFIIYPPQILLAPGQQQTVRVTWVGEPSLSQELSYRLVAEELEVSLQPDEVVPINGETKAEFELLLSYAGSVYVKPEGAQANVALQSAKPVELSDGNPGLEIHVKNQGNSRQLLTTPQLRLESQGKSILLQGPILEAINRQTILADGERKFTIPWPSDLPLGQVIGELLVN